jgi:hypothetical protein
MIDREKTEFRSLLMTLAAVHQRPIPAEVLDAYFEAMRPVSIEGVRRAFRAATSSCEFFPKPVELRALAATADSTVYHEVDGVPTFDCADCCDRGVIDRLHPKAGWMASPCDCMRGNALRERWQRPDSQGRVVIEQAKKNSRKLREMEEREDSPF